MPSARARQSHRDFPDEVRRGWALHATGRLRSAQKHYRQVLRNHPGHAEAMHLLGLSYHHGGQSAQAAPLILQAIGKASDVAPYYNSLGDCYRQLGRDKEATDSFRRALELDPTYARPHYNLALLCGSLGRREESRHHWREARRLLPAGGSLPESVPDVESMATQEEDARERARRASALPATQLRNRVGPTAEVLHPIMGGDMLNVVAIRDIIVPNGKALILRGGASEAFVLNVARDLVLGEGSRIQLEGGLTAGRVVWNLGLNDVSDEPLLRQIRTGRESVLEGALLAPDQFVFCSGTIHGQLVGLANCAGPARIVVEPSSRSNDQADNENWDATVDDLMAELGGDPTADGRRLKYGEWW